MTAKDGLRESDPRRFLRQRRAEGALGRDRRRALRLHPRRRQRSAHAPRQRRRGDALALGEPAAPHPAPQRGEHHPARLAHPARHAAHRRPRQHPPRPAQRPRVDDRARPRHHPLDDQHPHRPRGGAGDPLADQGAVGRRRHAPDPGAGRAHRRSGAGVHHEGIDRDRPRRGHREGPALDRRRDAVRAQRALRRLGA